MRAQTTLDFLVGMSTFLIVTAFVFAFVPGMLQPFSGGSQAETVAADRLAAQLAEGMLGDPANPYVLNVTCTTEFFKSDPADTPSCNYDQSPVSVNERLGVAKQEHLNVTITGNVTGPDGEARLCNDGTENVVERQSGGTNCDTTDGFAIGSAPPQETGSVVTARRVVYIDGTDATINVRVW